MSRPKPFSYFRVFDLYGVLELTVSQFNACAAMWGATIIDVRGDPCMSGDHAKMLARKLSEARKEDRLMVPLSFASADLGIKVDRLGDKLSALGSALVYVDGTPYISKHDYIALGGRALVSPEANTDDVPVHQPDMLEEDTDAF